MNFVIYVTSGEKVTMYIENSGNTNVEALLGRAGDLIKKMIGKKRDDNRLRYVRPMTIYPNGKAPDQNIGNFAPI